ncbi:uncharacterized protein K452DRAFT_340478 [Aplosporella prunicola CBS 121167]|uniref:Uncharacterized protein n=1 Tax=Aplosporella prunicola CBS 121167 TaxID=1176127 RepID=A0A6A6BPD9_9PEZI|nr:uncharacterized protein K452DRAFT_340478 [Aplosporella prunicola CBS 121167]KAF2145962.1 hypothetical protein K452DRAFT_340478 [Aplosporella prunicola CBS 121167]
MPDDNDHDAELVRQLRLTYQLLHTYFLRKHEGEASLRKETLRLWEFIQFFDPDFKYWTPADANSSLHMNLTRHSRAVRELLGQLAASKNIPFVNSIDEDEIRNFMIDMNALDGSRQEPQASELPLSDVTPEWARQMIDVFKQISAQITAQNNALTTILSQSTGPSVSPTSQLHPETTSSQPTRSSTDTDVATAAMKSFTKDAVSVPRQPAYSQEVTVPIDTQLFTPNNNKNAKPWHSDGYSSHSDRNDYDPNTSNLDREPDDTSARLVIEQTIDADMTDMQDCEQPGNGHVPGSTRSERKGLTLQEMMALFGPVSDDDARQSFIIAGE